MKRAEPLDDGSPDAAAIRGAIATIEHVTGVRPTGCPWRSFYSPIVREVLEVSWATQEGGGALPAIIGTDPPKELADALGVYRRAVSATRADEERISREEREAKRRVERATREANRRG